MRTRIAAAISLPLLLAACGDEPEKAEVRKTEWAVSKGFSSSVILRSAATSKHDPDIEITCYPDIHKGDFRPSINYTKTSYRRHELADLPEMPYDVVNINHQKQLITLDGTNIRFESVRVLGYVEKSAISYSNINVADFEQALGRASAYGSLEVKDPGSELSGPRYDLSNLKDKWPEFRASCAKVG